jgi:hypothetical protein
MDCFSGVGPSLRRVLHLSPGTYGLIYFLYIPIFGVIYNLFPTLISSESLVDALYFSVVTLTTLGYGDILPTTNLGKAIVSAQTLFGVLTIGLFLNALAELRSNSEAKRLSENSINVLELHVCLLLGELMKPGLLSWDRHAIHADSYVDLQEFTESVYLGVLNEKHKLSDAQIICFLSIVDQQHDTFVGLIPVAISISSVHGMQWISLVSNVRNLTQQYKKYADAPNEEVRRPSQNDVDMQIEELINSFFIICNKNKPIKVADQ